MGCVTLVNAKEQDGALTECPEHTGLWAWKHPHGDGTFDLCAAGDAVLVFDHVDFPAMTRRRKFSDICLYAEPGQKVAFVGATGAGKTTITNLINRFYDIADGKVRAMTASISTKSKKADLRRSLWHCIAGCKTCLPARSWKTFGTATGTPPMSSEHCGSHS